MNNAPIDKVESGESVPVTGELIDLDFTTPKPEAVAAEAADRTRAAVDAEKIRQDLQSYDFDDGRNSEVQSVQRLDQRGA